MPPVSRMLTRPRMAMKLVLRLRSRSYSPQPSGKAKASSSALTVPRYCSALSFIRISEGITMLMISSMS
ncbi:hypothetical protein D3C85_1428970 [compost metagenome]